MQEVLSQGFYEMSENEMSETDGGAEIFGGIVLGFLIDAACKTFTGKGVADWVDEGVRAAANGINNLFK